MRKCPGSVTTACVTVLVTTAAVAAQQGGRSIDLRNHEGLAGVIDEYRAIISERMAAHGVPGLAIALVDGEGIVWAEGFGHVDRTGGRAVDPKTTFSLQSASKSFTALAALVGVRDGLVTLDEPIASYLPQFSVRTRWAPHPERRMTLRHLLSHRAGFTHEAPVGNNYIKGYPSFEAHIRSIADTWLRYPVGERHSYSNLGVDLAGHVLSVVSGMSFPDYMRDRVLEPLGMTGGSFDWEVVRATENRALGHWTGFEDVPLEFALIPSGGLYASIEDMAAFVRFHLSGALPGDRTLLPDTLLSEMYAIQFPEDGQVEGYGLGLRRFHRYDWPHFNHNGAGFGFQSHVSWYPAYGFGIVVLTNAMGHDLTSRLPYELVDRVLETTLVAVPLPEPRFPDLTGKWVEATHKQRFIGTFVGRPAELTFQLRGDTLGAALGRQFGFVELQFVADKEAYVDVGQNRWLLRFAFRNDGSPSHVTRVHDGETFDYYFGPNDPPGTADASWSAYEGNYVIRVWGQVAAEVAVEIRDGHLLFNNAPLTEYGPGLFFTPGGEALDFRGPIPTWRNIRLERRPD